MAAMTTETSSAIEKPSGTKAFLYAVLSLLTAGVLWLVLFVLARGVGIDVGFAVMGFTVAVVSALVGLVVGVIKRLSTNQAEQVRLPRVARFAVAVPVVIALVGFIAGLAVH